MSQSSKILHYLKQGHALTPISALRMFDCMRLGGRIYDLRKRGHQITTSYVSDWRKRKRWASYRLAGKR